MKKYSAHMLLVISGSLLLAEAALAETTVTEAFQKSTVNVNFRLRYEDVSWGGLEDSDAFTLRSRLTWQSAEYHKFGLTAEVDDVRELDSVDYRTAANDTSNPGTAIIADPEDTEINQAYVSYNNFKTAFKYGRQRIILDNQRFIGAVGWRQNEQTYDAFSFNNTGLTDTTIFYAYVTNVNRVFGDDNPIGDQDQETHLFNINYAGLSAGKLSAYAYVIDNLDAQATSSDTFGARWMGKINDNFSYNLEYATQTEGGENPVDYSADYFLAEAVGTFSPITATLGYELLGSDDGVIGFATPFATLHAFQGWADIFLTTPTAGIEDVYLNLGATLVGMQWQLSYHELASDVDAIDYGSEIDFSVSKKIGPVVYTAKYADFQSDDVGVDATKFWLMAVVGF